MSRAERVILTNMCMVTDDRGNVLVQNRKDPNWPGIVFPGGHVEPGEAFVDSVIREVREETGITVLNPMLCGVKQFHTREGERYIVFFFKAAEFEGQLRSSEEGEAMWIPRTELFSHNCVDGLEDMIQLFENEGFSELFYHSHDEARFL